MDPQIKKKKTPSWKRYGMEFLMVFAAITLGFLQTTNEKRGEKMNEGFNMLSDPQISQKKCFPFMGSIFFEMIKDD
jgi:hypothetical protein